MPEPQNALIRETTLRVRYAETDAQGVVYHSNYLIYFEVGRGAYMRDQGLDYRAMEEAGTRVAVVEVQARYLAPARYDDELTVRSWPKEVRTRSFDFGYEVLCGSKLLCVGSTGHVCLGPDDRPVRLPEDLAALLGKKPG
jgi:acyl-CoA thioester hydrolase